MKVKLSLLATVVVMLLGIAAAKDASPLRHKASMALNSYTRAPRNIATANVFDLDGKSIGRVQKLDLDPAGKPKALTVVLSPSGYIMDVAAYNVSYDEQKNAVTVGLNQSPIVRKSQLPSR